jgi:Tfp pilus assembly protein PilO
MLDFKAKTKDYRKGGDKEKEKKKKPPSALWVRYYKSVLALMVIAIAVVGWFVVVGPLYGDYAALDVAAKHDEYETNKRVLDNFNNIKEEWESISEQDKQKLDYFLPTGKDIPGLVAMLDTMAKQSGFVATKISLSYSEEPLEDMPEVFPVLVSMSVEGGSYSGLKQFIDKIENNLRILDIGSLSFQSAKSIYVLNIYTYYLKGQE